MNPRIDSHKLEFHPHRVAAWRDSGGDWERAKSVYPIYVEMSPVGACNHRCQFCAVDYIGYEANRLSVERMKEILPEMGKLGVKSIMWAGEGEPLLHKDINALNFAAHEAGIDTSFTTNGTLLDKLTLRGTTWVKVSVNAGTRKSYEDIHRAKSGDWEKVWKNIEDAASRKGNCTLGVQTLMLPEIAGEIGMLAERARDAGVDYLVVKPYSQHRFSITHKYEGVDYSSWGWLEEALKSFDSESFRVYFRAESAATKEIPYLKCNATPFFWAYVMATGEVYSCSAYLKDPRFLLGNVNEQSFQQIWEGDKRKANWEFVREGLDISECRVNCRMDKANRYLDGFDSVSHVNFI